MPSVNELLQAVVGMQGNAQSALPVIPNNGNPQGANNMPAATAAVMPTLPAADKYPWLKPSANMDVIQQLLSRPIMSGYQGPMPGTPEFREARQAGEHPIMDYLRQQRQSSQGLPVMPRPAPNMNTGIVPPQFQEQPHTMGGPVLPYDARRPGSPVPVIAK